MLFFNRPVQLVIVRLATMSPRYYAASSQSTTAGRGTARGQDYACPMRIYARARRME